MTVEIVEEGATVTVAVSDDGSGFERADVSRGFGLVGMEERVVLVGGTLVVDSKPGGGTRVRAELPASHVEPPPASRGRGV